MISVVVMVAGSCLSDPSKVLPYPILSPMIKGRTARLLPNQKRPYLTPARHGSVGWKCDVRPKHTEWRGSVDSSRRRAAIDRWVSTKAVTMREVRIEYFGSNPKTAIDPNHLSGDRSPLFGAE